MGARISMVYKFTKADEGKYFLGISPFGEGWQIYVYCYIIKVTEEIIVYYKRPIPKGEDRDIFDLCKEPENEKERQKREEIWLKWRFEISKIDDNSLPDNLTECYPLELVVLGLFRQPSKHLTKKQRQQIKDFESQIKD